MCVLRFAFAVACSFLILPSAGCGGCADDTLSAHDASLALDTSSDVLPSALDALGAVDSTPGDDAGDLTLECARVTAEAEMGRAPVDVIIAVDTSSSMHNEAALVRDNIQRLVDSLTAVDVDAQVFLLGRDVHVPETGWSVEVVPTLTGESADRFRHVDVRISSTDALQKIVDQRVASLYRRDLRDEAVTHVMVVTDEESSLTGAEFERRFREQFGRTAHFHAVASPPVEPATCEDFADGFTQAQLDALRGDGFDYFVRCAPACDGVHGPAGWQGRVYWELADMTGGTTFSICNERWDQLFEALTSQAEISSRLPCSYVLPEVPEGYVIDPTRIAITLTDGDDRSVFGAGPDASTCAANSPGLADQWHFDRASNPSRIDLCPAACELIQRAGGGSQVDVVIGCTPDLI